jgi:hypothetical protein
MRFYTQTMRALHAEVMQGVMTPQQAQERIAMMQATQPHAFLERSIHQQLPIINQFSPLQHVIRAQDPSHVGRNLNPPGVSHPQGQAPLQQSIVLPYPPVPPTNVQCSSSPFASQAPPSASQQVPAPSNLSNLSSPQLRVLHAQLVRFVIEGERALQASSATSGESDDQRQQLRAKVDLYKQRLLVLQKFISAKTREA